MYTDPTPLSLGSYKTTDGFDIYAQTEYPFESKQAQQDIALKCVWNIPHKKNCQLRRFLFCV